METINQIIQQVINSFDFTYCVVVNVLTYKRKNVVTNAKEKNKIIWQ